MTNAPSVTCASTRHAACTRAGEVRNAGSDDKNTCPAVAAMSERHDKRADTMGVVNRNLRCPLRRKNTAENQRKIGNGQSGVRVPHRGADDDLDVDEGRRRRCDQAKRTVVDRVDPGTVQPRDVKSAMAIVRQKKICARPACAVETGVGRKYSTVIPPRRPCTHTAASAVNPSTRIHRAVQPSRSRARGRSSAIPRRWRSADGRARRRCRPPCASWGT